MAYPQVRSYSTGRIDTANTAIHDIGLPSNIAAGDLLVVFITTKLYHGYVQVDPSVSTSNFYYYEGHDGGIIYDQVERRQDWVTVCLTTILARANGSGSDMLRIRTKSNPLTEHILNTQYDRYSRISYLCYSIANVRFTASDSVPGRYNADIRYRVSLGKSSNWDLNRFYDVIYDDYIVEEFLWLCTIGADLNAVATSAPPGYTNLITVKTPMVVMEPTSISSFRTTTDNVSSIDPGPCVAPDIYWKGITLKIFPGEGSGIGGIQHNPSSGVGIYIRNEDIKIHDINPVVTVSPFYIYFNADGSINPDRTDIVEITSNGLWSASWTSNQHFDSSLYSGSSGVCYSTISCREINTSGVPYTDTLTITSGTTSRKLRVFQAK